MIDNSRVKNHLFFGFVEKACAEHVFLVLLQAYNKRPDLIDAPWVESAALVPGCCYTGFAMEVMSPVSTPERRVHYLLTLKGFLFVELQGMASDCMDAVIVPFSLPFSFATSSCKMLGLLLHAFPHFETLGISLCRMTWKS